MLLYGEQFEISTYREQVVCSHPRWALVGVGDTIEEAKEDLEVEIENAYQEFLETDDKYLTSDLQELKYWLIKIHET